MLAHLVIHQAPTSILASVRRPGRTLRAGAAALMAVAALGASAPGALAQGLGNPVAPLSPTVTTSSTQVVTAVSSSSSSSIGASTTVAIIVLIAAIALIAGIAWFILRDARSHTPAREGPLGAPQPRRSVEQRQRDRAKAKAARQQRKRNR
jgi:hypothetical protein